MSDPELPLTYRIKTVRDFLTVPVERRSVCLREFAVWLEIDNCIGAVLRGVSLEKPDAFVWTDDDKHHVTAAVVAGDERIEIVSGTMKGFE